jgi:UDP-GlcNAc:undecaprenyl-phosphate GlcNAc-1-phosphate transferase
MVLPLFFIAFLLGLLGSLLVLRFFPKLGLMDRPERYGHKRAPVPYPAGVAPVMVIFFLLLAFLPWDKSLGFILLGASLIFGTSFWDDRRGLPPVLRLGVQVVAALCLVAAGLGISSLSNPFGAPFILDAWQIPFQIGAWDFTFTPFSDLLTILWVVVLVNAFNWIDGVAGMVNGVTIASSAIILLLSLKADFHSVDQTMVIVLATVVLGSAAALFPFNFPPARVLLGDTGSMTFGFLVATMAIASGGKIATTALVLSFPLLDFAWVIVRRWWTGQSIFKGDLAHFHHRLMNRGLSERQVVVFFTFASALFGSMALLLHTQGKVWAFIGIGCFMSLAALFLVFRK